MVPSTLESFNKAKPLIICLKPTRPRKGREKEKRNDLCFFFKKKENYWCWLSLPYQREIVMAHPYSSCRSSQSFHSQFSFLEKKKFNQLIAMLL